MAFIKKQSLEHLEADVGLVSDQPELKRRRSTEITPLEKPTSKLPELPDDLKQKQVLRDWSALSTIVGQYVIVTFCADVYVAILIVIHTHLLYYCATTSLQWAKLPNACEPAFDRQEC